MLVLILSTLAAWPLVLTKAQPYYASGERASQLDGSSMYVSPGGVIGGQDQLLGYQLVPAGQSYNHQPGASLEQPLLDKLADIFLQQSLQQSTFSVGNAGYGSGQTKNVYQAQSLGTPQKNIQVAGQPKSGYGKKRQKVKKSHKPVYVPVPIKKQRRKKKKSKTLSVSKGFYIAGGSEIFGKFKTLKSCQKACDSTAHCLGGDYNKWTKRCYMHTNTTACSAMQPHKQLTHFKKVPCAGNDLGITYSRITLGTRLDHGLLQKGVKDIQSCIKKCLQAGGGVAPTLTTTNTPDPGVSDLIVANAILDTPQLCFGIDYDFATHKCYFHTSVTVATQATTDAATGALVFTNMIIRGIPGGIVCVVQSNDAEPLPPVNLVGDSSVVNIVICPQPSAIP